MSNIIKFPKACRGAPGTQRQEMPKPASTARAPRGKGRRFLTGLFGGIWLLTVLLSPLLQWVLKYDCVFQLIRMLYYWNTPGMHAGWTFLLHFGAMTGLFCYVAFGKPKGFEMPKRGS